MSNRFSHALNNGLAFIPNGKTRTEVPTKVSIPSKRNLAHVESAVSFDPRLDSTQRLLLADAQSSGGLLLAVPADRLEALLAALRGRNAPVAAEIGEITDDRSGRIEVRP